MDIPTHRIQHLLRVYTDHLKFNQINIAKEAIPACTFQDEFNLSLDGKKKQLIDQLIVDAVVQLTMGVRQRKAQKIAEDSPDAIFPADGRRKLYGSLIEDSRRG